MARGGYSLVAVHGLLVVVASLVADVPKHRLSSCGTGAQLLHSMWDLPRPKIEPVSPASAGRVFTAERPKKPFSLLFMIA